MEWTSVLGSRAFLDVLYGNWYNFFPLRPVRDFGLYDGPWTPPRQDTATLVWSQHRRQQRLPGSEALQAAVLHHAVVLQGRLEGLATTCTFGFDWKRDRRSLFNDQPFDIWYRDNNGALAQVDLYNSNVTGINDVVYTSGWVNDTWKLTNRLTLNLGAALRELPGRLARAVARRRTAIRRSPAGPTRAISRSSRPKTVSAQTVANSNTLSPKIGFAYDLTGDNRTVLKAFYGLSRWNSADVLADQENPVGLAQLRYAFVSCAAGQTTGCDLNGDRLVSSPAELGSFQSTQGGGGFVRVDRDLVRPISHEVSINLEREITQRPLGPRVVRLQEHAQRVGRDRRRPRPRPTPCRSRSSIPASIASPARPTTRPSTPSALAAGIGQDRVFTNTDDNADFQNVEFAVNRRFSDRG